MKTKGKPSDIDLYVGARIREARLDLGLSQDKTAEWLGISFQQIQKYERGANRISAGRLAQLSKFLEKPISWFFPEEYAEGIAVVKMENKIAGLKTRLETISQIAEYKKPLNGHQGA